MPLTNSLITTICLSASSINNQACTHALDAAAQQTSTTHNADLVETYVRKQAGDDINAGLGVGVYGYRMYRTKAVTYKVPKTGLWEAINIQIGEQKSTLGFVWKF